MSDSDSDVVPDNLAEIKEEIEQYKRDPKTAGMFVSGWDDADVDVDIVKNPKESPTQHILWAAENGELATLRELLEQDSRLVHARDADGYTPMHRAAYNGHVEVISTLLASGADVMARTNDGWTPLHSAANWNNHRAAARLLTAGADLNAKTEGGQTPLHLCSAISHCHSTLVLFLTNPEIELHHVNNAGETAVQLASAKGQYAPLFDMAQTYVNHIKSREFTDNPFIRDTPLQPL